MESLAMELSFNLVDWQALAPGLTDQSAWTGWASAPSHAIPLDAAMPASACIPMMTARRMSTGCRLAVEVGLTLMQVATIDAVVFSSRHGELERSHRILCGIAEQKLTSPTDFAMSVHNTAAGTLTITAQAPVVVSSLSAGTDSFQQAIVEAYGFLSDGANQVLVVDFDGNVPDFYHPYLEEPLVAFPYAVALVLAKGHQLRCRPAPHAETQPPNSLPQSIQCLAGLLSGQPQYRVSGRVNDWLWSYS